MIFFPCTSCNKKALNPHKYFLEGDSSPSGCFRLPFEFNEDDKLGPWDIFLSEDTIKDLQQLKSTTEIRIIMKKLGQLSSGAWDKHGLKCTVQTSIIPIYEIIIPDNNGLKILWQVDCGFSIRSNSFTQLIKIWTATANQEQIDKILKSLIIFHQGKQNKWRMTEQTGKDGIILPVILGAEEDEDKFHNSEMDGELLEIHNMFVTNKFYPLSTVKYI